MMMITLFWDLMLYDLAGAYQPFERNWRGHVRSRTVSHEWQEWHLYSEEEAMGF
jgi:hypothetical protein